VGDVEEQVTALNAGFIVDLKSDRDIERLASKLTSLKSFRGEQLRNNAYHLLDLHIANNRYAEVYRKLKNKFVNF
jgi:hypothetical protein